jgi:hypothetical protein
MVYLSIPTWARASGVVSMADGTFLRVFTFEPSQAGVIDSILRDQVMPALCQQAGILDAYAARHGPDESGQRVVASVWNAEQAMAAGAIEGDIISRAGGELADPGRTGVDMLPVDVRLSFERTDPARILRVFRGWVREGGVHAYARDVETGATDDASGGVGLVALYLGALSTDRFITVSAWTSWEAIEAATGGNLERPIATRFPDRIGIEDVCHYEIVPGTTRPTSQPLMAVPAGG